MQHSSVPRVISIDYDLHKSYLRGYFVPQTSNTRQLSYKTPAIGVNKVQQPLLEAYDPSLHA